MAMTGTPTVPAERYDVVMCDLDGVVYVGRHAVPGVADHLDRVRAAGSAVAFVTNNASRTPEMVADHLTDLGVPAQAQDVVTSAQAAARVVRETHGTDRPIALLGGEGLRVALDEVGVRYVDLDEADDTVAAVVSGYGPDVAWRHIMKAAVLIAGGVPYVASNTDKTIPTPAGMAPGHGVLVEVLERFSGREATVAGKPAPPLLEETIRRVGASRPLMVGDRMDTDILGARRVGIDSLLVMTGVTDLDALLAAPADWRPTYLGWTLEALHTPAPDPVRTPDGVTVDGWSARVEDGGVRLQGSGTADAWLVAAATAGWDHLDAYGTPARAPESLPAGIGVGTVAP